MKTANNPENQQPHGLGNLGQISTSHAYPQWVVVEQAGTDDESIVNDHYTFREAAQNIARNYYPDEREELGVQIMKRLPDGTLTTEF